MSLLLKLTLIAGAGAAGAVARYGLTHATGWVLRPWTPDGWVWGTLAVNTLGCLLFGVVWAATEGKWPGAVEVRYAVLVGFLGSFTTFSTFAFEAVGLGVNQRPLLAAVHVAAHVGLGVAGVAGGLWLGARLLASSQA
ncbi:MAG: CrcB family protein [Phycisphaeraceae bacterium]